MPFRCFVHRPASDDFQAFQIGQAALAVGGEVVSVSTEPNSSTAWDLGPIAVMPSILYRVWMTFPTEEHVVRFDAECERLARIGG